MLDRLKFHKDKDDVDDDDELHGNISQKINI